MQRNTLRAVRAAALAVSLLVATPTLADSVPVPAGVQANLVAKLLSFDRALPSRANGTVRILVLVDPSEGQSQKIANEFATAMKSRDKIAGLPVELVSANFDSAAGAATKVRNEHFAAVYLSSGLARSAEAIATALKGVDVMTIAAEPSAVIRGISVGFDLLSGQPKILVNLAQAKNQNVQLPASVLALAVIQG